MLSCTLNVLRLLALLFFAAFCGNTNFRSNFVSSSQVTSKGFDAMLPKITILLEMDTHANRTFWENSSIYRKVQAIVDDVLYDERREAVVLNSQIIPLFTNANFESEVNRLKVTRDIVCRQLLNRSAAVLLVQNSKESTGGMRAVFSTAAYALGFYHIPAIGVMIQDVEFSRKNLYPTFLRTSSPFSHEAFVIIKLLEKLAYRQVIVMVVDGDLNGQEFMTIFEELCKNSKIHIQSRLKLQINEKLSQTIAKEFAETTSNTIILHAKRQTAEHIFDASAGFTTTAGRLWITNEAAAGAKNLPVGFLSVRQRQSVGSALRDALIVVRDGIQFLNRSNIREANRELWNSVTKKPSDANASDFPRPPSQCPRALLMNADNEWTARIGTMFYKYLISSTFHGDVNPIQFNEKGDRVAVAYDVLNVHQGGVNTIVGHLSERGDFTLEESAIRWPGGGIRRPLEITLPRHLRVVAVEDAPFVYTIATSDATRCANYGSFIIDGVKVKGPWYPCRTLAAVKEKNETARGVFDEFRADYRKREIFHCCAGFAIDLLSNLSTSNENGFIDTSFTYDIHLNESYGAVLLASDGAAEALDEIHSGGTSSGSSISLSVSKVGYVLSGMIGELDADTADLAIGAFTINPEREKYIDFSEPWHYHGIRILEKWKPRDSPMQSFLQPLKSTLWTALFIAVFCVGAIIFFLDLNSPFERFFDVVDDFFLPARDVSEDDSRVTFGESMWFVWGVLLNSGVCEKTPRSFSARVLGLVWCGFCMIIVASYTANLAAFLVLDQPEKSLSGVADPRLKNPSANFSYATVLHTNTYQYFKRHVELSTMFRKMERHNVRAASEAINGLLNDTLGAFIWDSVRLEFEASRHCVLKTRGALFGRSAYGIGLQKNSPWTPHITEKILRLSETGLMERLELKWIREAGRDVCALASDKTPARLGLRSMRDGLILVLFGIGISALLSAAEFRVARLRKRQMKSELLAKRAAEKWLRLAKRRRAFFHFTLLGVGANNKQQTDQNDADALASSKAATALAQRESEAAEKKARFKEREIFVPNHNFNRKPCRLYCSRCHNIVESVPRPRVGRLTIAVAVVCVLTLLWPLAVLSFFLTVFADYVHYCPVKSCAHKLGRYRRLGRPHFYV